MVWHAPSRYIWMHLGSWKTTQKSRLALGYHLDEVFVL